MILSLDTATKICSIAVHDQGNLVVEQNFHLDKSHSSLLPSAIDTIFSQIGIDKKDIKAVAISDGPGSYTGLRIGTATAKGLCFSWDVPLIAVNTLLAMSQEANKHNLDHALLVPMLDARRMEVYTMIIDPELNVLIETHAHILEETSFSEYKDKNLIYFGNGSDKAIEILSKNKNFRHVEQIHTYARSVGEIAWKKFEKEIFEDLAYYEPNYLKEFQAKKPKALI